MIPYKYSQLINRLDYNESVKIPVKKIHLGQLKLFFLELLFLSMWAKDGNKVLYVGAANGYHIGKLAELFPNLTFDLWDPCKFEIKETSNIKIFNYFFTNDDAKKYTIMGNNILFMCDIRTLTIGKFEKIKDTLGVDNIVSEDILCKQNGLATSISNLYISLYINLKD